VRLVLDTNVLIAAFVARGLCHELLEYCVREHQCVTSSILLDEFTEKLARKFKAPLSKVEQAKRLLEEQMEIVASVPLANTVCRDPDDDWVLATALTGRCELIITGDDDLLILKTHATTRILSPAEFWRKETRRSPA
jgi:uncharacterized protein